MKCVSYTRATSSDPFAVEPKNTIGLQNKYIADFVKANGWNLCAKYSDRKVNEDCDTAFQEMKEAVLRREYECIVVDSFNHFGKSLPQAIEFVTKTMIPAGIFFAVAEDAFCSADVTAKQVMSYLMKKRSRYAHDMTKSTTLSKEYCFRTYGFQFDEERNKALLDMESAKIVKEIFQRMSLGELQSSIARDLTQRGVENPNDYFYRNAKRKGWKGTHDWNTNAINAIVEDVKYIGIYEGGFDPEDVNIDFDPIIDSATFQKVREMRRKHTTYTGGKPKDVGNNGVPLSGFMFDKESNTPLRYQNRGSELITYTYPKNGKFRYAKSKMDYPLFCTLAEEQLQIEKKRCMNVLQMLETDECNVLKEKRMEMLKARIHQLLKKTKKIEARKMKAYRKYRNGQMEKDQYDKQEDNYKRQLRHLDNVIVELLDHIDSIDTIFSEKNPWIRLYRSYEEGGLSSYDIRKYVEKMLVYRFESVELVPKKEAYRNELPREWLEVRSNGQNQ